MEERTLILHPNQEKKILRAHKKNKGCVLKVDEDREVDLSDQEGPMRGKFALHPSRLKDGKLRLTRDDMKKQPSGGIISLILAGLLGTILGEVVGSAISGGTIFSKTRTMREAIRPGLIWDRGDSAFAMESQGRGYHLSPWRGRRLGEGLYLRPYRKSGRGIRLLKSGDLNALSAPERNLLKTIVNYS